MKHKESKCTYEILNKLPQDIVTCVLLRFPGKSLMRFQSVSKSWYLIIHSTTFTILHHNHTIASKKEFIFFTRLIQEEYEEYKTILSVLSNDISDNLNPLLHDCDVPEFTSAYSSISDELIGPCHGLIGLMGSTSIILLNPTTRHYRVLPPSPFSCPKGFYHSIIGVGFGFDQIVNEYKVIIISEVYTDPYEYPYRNIFKRRVEVYDVFVDSWRELYIVDQQQPSIYRSLCCQKFYNNCCHWFTHTAYKNGIAIFCFDITTETFRIMKMPGCCCFHGLVYGLVVLNKLLTLICYPLDPQVGQTQDLIDIWIMKEYGVTESWIRKYTIKPLPIESPLEGWKDYLLFFQSKTGFLISYNVNTDEVKEFNLQGYPGSLRVVVYSESLTKIPRGNTHNTEVKFF